MDDGTLAMAITEIIMFFLLLVFLVLFAAAIGFGFSLGRKIFNKKFG